MFDVRILRALGFLAIVVAGQPLPAAQAAQAPLGGVRSVTIWEGGCFYYATCSTYEMQISPDGAYRLEARDFVRNPGISTGQLEAGAWAKIEAAVRAADFKNLPERLDQSAARPEPDGAPCISDAPGVRLGVAWPDGTHKEVFWDRGCPSQTASDLVDALRGAIGYERLVRPEAQP